MSGLSQHRPRCAAPRTPSAPPAPWRRCASRRASATAPKPAGQAPARSEEHTSELQSLMRISYAVFCLKKKKITITQHIISPTTHTDQTNNTQKTYYYIKTVITLI